MKEKIVRAIAAVSASMMLFGMTTLAAPKTMSDGGTFDPEYYAQQNPDVVAALGTDENLLYQHYLNNGKAEGRLPYAQTGTASTSALTSPSIVATRKFKHVSSEGTNSRLTQFVNWVFKKDIVTVQEMSDGTLFVSHTKTTWVDVFAPTGEANESATYYQCVGSSSGKVSNVTLLYDTDKNMVGTLNYSDSGSYEYSSLYMTEDLLG